MALLSTIIFTQFLTTNLAKARTLILTCMCLFQWFNAWNCRSETRSLFSLNFFANGWLLLATFAVILLQMLILYVPFFQNVFSVVPLTFYEWMLLTVIASSIIWFEEIRKLIFKKMHKEFI